MSQDKADGRSHGSSLETLSEIETGRYVLQRVAACCGVLRCVALCCSVGGVKAPFRRLFSRLRRNDMCCSMLQCVAVWEESKVLF